MSVSFKNLIKTLRFGGGPYRCNICGRSVRKFFPFSEDLQRAAREQGFAHDFCAMETLNVEQCNCPFCLSNDRERLYLIYLEDFLSNHAGDLRLLDFAPNPEFSSRLRKLPQVRYTSADLFREDVDLRLDVCDMRSVDAAAYDAIICSHVLEHVPDPDKATQELHRILIPGGWAIVMVPLFSDVPETIEDSDHTTDALRTRYYGQFDHVRLFSQKDFIQRLKNAGFSVRQITPDQLNAGKVKEHALAANSILYVFTKPN